MVHDLFLAKVAGIPGTGHNSSHQWLKGNRTQLQHEILQRKAVIASGYLLVFVITIMHCIML